MPHVRGALVYGSAFSENEVREIRIRYANRAEVFCSQYSLAEEFGVSRAAVHYIVQRRSWGWVDDGIPPARYSRNPPKSPAQCYILFWTEERIARLRELFTLGWTYAAIGQDIGCSRCAVGGKLTRLQLYRRWRGGPYRRRPYTKKGEA